MALVRRGLHHKKWADLFGKPDFVFEHSRLAVFVDGCYFHRCPRHMTTPKGNRDFWVSKFVRNVARDLEVTTRLRAEGWHVLRFWECDVKKFPEACVAQIEAKISNG